MQQIAARTHSGRRVFQAILTGLSTLALVPLLLAGCAGGLGTTRHTTLIDTEPAGARCDLHGTGYARQIAAPERVEIPKSAAPVTMRCSAPGHRTLETTLKPRFNPKVLGNFVVGSSLGMVSDMVGGHDEIYPKRVRLNLEPVAFPSLAARDAWFDRYRRATVIRWTMRLDALRHDCDGRDDYACLAIVSQHQRKRDAELALLERRRDAAHVTDDIAERPFP